MFLSIFFLTDIFFLQLGFHRVTGWLISSSLELQPRLFAKITSTLMRAYYCQYLCRQLLHSLLLTACCVSRSLLLWGVLPCPPPHTQKKHCSRSQTSCVESVMKGKQWLLKNGQSVRWNQLGCRWQTDTSKDVCPSRICDSNFLWQN